MIAKDPDRLALLVVGPATPLTSPAAAADEFRDEAAPFYGQVHRIDGFLWWPHARQCSGDAGTKGSEHYRPTL
jgi:hypothetical protein